MKHQVFWKNPGYKPRPELKEDIACNYLIVGGGVTGVSLAYFLSKLGAKKIVLIEKHSIASGATGKSAGMLSTRGELDLSHIKQEFGVKKMAKLWKEIHYSVNMINHIIKEEKINCEAEPQDTLYCGSKHRDYNDVNMEFELESKLEKDTKMLFNEELKKELNTKLYNHGLLSHHHGLSVNPLKFIQNLSKVLDKKGVKIYENTAFIKLLKKDTAKTMHGNIKFKKIIFAIDSEHPSKEVKNMKSTILVTSPLSKKQLAQTGLIKKKLIWNSKKNYEYFKLTKDNRLLVGSGGVSVHKKHKKTDPHFPHLKQIEKFVKNLFPYLNLKFDYAWSGSFGFTEGFIPFLEHKGNTYSIAGASDQILCIMSSRHIASKLLGKNSFLKDFFEQ